MGRQRPSLSFQRAAQRRSRVRSLLALFIGSALASVLFSNALLLASERRAHTVTIVATVRPLRVIIVDENLTIQQILSNTMAEVRPLVVLDSADGQELPYAEGVRRQYEALKPTLNFHRPGILYERDERPVPALIGGAVRSWGRWLALPF